MLDRAIIAKYDRSVPRYTSYPTAPHFHAGIGPDRATEWLGAVELTRAVSLYLHVPFCSEMCWYCGCHTKITQRAEPVARYAQTLTREIDLVADRLPGRARVAAIHFGGGTPNQLEPRDLTMIMDRIAGRFDLTSDAEIAVEADPRSLSDAWIAAAAACGVNRVSLGVQDLDPEVQRAIGRVQPTARVALAIERLRQAGIAAVNFDLIYGLPFQRTGTFAAMIEAALALGPDRIALYGYAHVPWLKTHQRLIDEAHLPDAAARWALQDEAAAVLAARGYVRIGLDHYARPEDPLARAAAARRVRRNFQGYTTDDAEALLGLGASAIGTFPQGYVQNAADLRAWAAAITAGRLATVRGRAIDDEDRLRREVIGRLMCDMEVDLVAVARAYGRGPEAFIESEARLEELRADGVIERRDALVRVSESGRPLARTVAAAFDAYLAAAAARHSRAV